MLCILFSDSDSRKPPYIYICIDILLHIIRAIDNNSLDQTSIQKLPLYFAITSTYPRPFFAFFTVPPFLACGTPIKSSIPIAPLCPVAGLEGGPDGGPAGEPDTPRGLESGGAAALLSIAGVIVREACRDAGLDDMVVLDGPGMFMDGLAVAIGRGGTGGALVMVWGGGAPTALTALDGGPLGGGGRGALAFSCSAGSAFLLTHLPFSLSK